MNPRKFTLIILVLCSFVFAEDLIIDLKTFPRPSIVTNRLNGDIIIDGFINEA